jgi:hypothetical protein
MWLRWCLATLLIAVLSIPGQAQDAYPSRMIKVILPSAAGSTTDLLARLIADRLSQKWGKPVIVENIAGAGMSIGATQAFRSPADGYTLFLSPPSHDHQGRRAHGSRRQRPDAVHRSGVDRSDADDRPRSAGADAESDALARGTATDDHKVIARRDAGARLL